MAPPSMPRRRPARGQGSRARFGTTWWGQAWVEALEHRAQLDPNRLPRGRSYLRWGNVGPLTAEPGEVRAPVQGSRSAAYRIRVRVRPFSAAEWDAVIDAVAARAGHAAALLDGELPPAVVEDVAAAGLDLLPGPGEVGTSCSCPDWANPCKHAAAVCYQIADLLDQDPFTLLLLRGRARDEVLAALRSRRAAAAGVVGAGTTGVVHRSDDPGVPAREAFAPAEGVGTRRLLPHVPLPAPHPGRPAPLATDPSASAGFSTDELVALASDGARRAWELAVGEGDGGLALPFDIDLARRADAALGTPALDGITRRAGMTRRQVVRLATAWRQGGAGGVGILAELWEPSIAAVDEAVAALRAAGAERVRVDGNRVSGRGVQLRFGPDGLWYRLERRRGSWELAGPPDPDPAELLLTAFLDR